jgi:hypothetical protein
MAELNGKITEWSPEYKKETDVERTPTAYTDDRGLNLQTDLSPSSPTQQSIGGVTYTFYAHSVSAGTGQGIPKTIVVDRNCKIQEVYLQVETAPGSGKTLTIDVNNGGTTIFTTQANRPSITDTETTGVSLAPDLTNVYENDELTMDVDTNNGSAAKMSVYVRCVT